MMLRQAAGRQGKFGAKQEGGRVQGRSQGCAVRPEEMLCRPKAGQQMGIGQLYILQVLECLRILKVDVKETCNFYLFYLTLTQIT